jgi:excisionase family DNA binding protein
MSLLTYAQAAEQLGVSVATVRREVADGKIRSVPVRRRVFIRAAELDAYILRNRGTPCQSEKIKRRVVGSSSFSSAESEFFAACDQAREKRTRKRSSKSSAATSSTRLTLVGSPK